jgi:hypothetical protein
MRKLRNGASAEAPYLSRVRSQNLHLTYSILQCFL